MYVSDGRFDGSLFMNPQWTHVVLNYIALDHTEGIQIYQDGIQKHNDDTKETGTYSAGDGRVVLGKYFTHFPQDDDYEGVEVDELLFFNAALNSDQITDLLNIT